MLHKCQSCTDVIQMFCVHWAVMEQLFYTYFQLKHVLFQTRQGGLHTVWKYIFCDFSSGISYLIIKNQMSTYKICNIMGYRVSLIQFTKKWRCGHAVVIQIRYIYWYRITCISYMKLGFPTFYGAEWKMTWHPVYSHSAHADNLWKKMPKWRSTWKRDVTNVRFLHNSTTCRKNEIYYVKLQNFTFPMIYYLSLGGKREML